MNIAQDVLELEKLGAELQTIIDKPPADIQELSEEDIMKLEGGEDLLMATLNFAAATSTATTRLIKDVMDDYSDIFDSLSDDDDDEY